MELSKLLKEKITPLLLYKEKKILREVFNKGDVQKEEPELNWAYESEYIEREIKRKIGTDFPRKEDFREPKRIKYNEKYHKSNRLITKNRIDQKSEDIVKRNLKIAKEERKLTKEEHEYLIECLEDLDILAGEIEVEQDIREEELKEIIIVGKEETGKSTFLEEEIEQSKRDFAEINWNNSECCLLNEFIWPTINVLIPSKIPKPLLHYESNFFWHLSSQFLLALEGKVKTKEDFSAVSHYRATYYKEQKESIKDALSRKESVLGVFEAPEGEVITRYGIEESVYLFNINKKIDKFAKRFFEHDTIGFHLFVFIFEQLFNTIFFHRTNEHVLSQVLENLKRELTDRYRASIWQLEYQATRKKRQFYLSNIIDKIARLVNEIDHLDQYIRQVENNFDDYLRRSILTYPDLTETI
jgi:hypothetical protein